MLPPLTRDQCRRIDRLAAAQLGVPTVVLMENAARGAAEVIAEHAAGRPVAIVCGGGNNGGDGYAAARHLHRLGVPVTLHAVKPLEALTGDAAINATICDRLGLAIVMDDRPLTAGVLVDALLGTGFEGRHVRAPTADAIRRINAGRAGGAMVVALDVPSGLDCDTGEPAEPTVVADVTVTFVAGKTGFASSSGRSRVGEVVVCDIGLPEPWIRRALDL